MSGPKVEFTFSQTAKLADVPVATVRDWFNLKNGPFSLQLSDRQAPPGGVRYLGPFTVMAVCIAAALTKLGVPISRASVAGMTFAHTDRGRPARNYPGARYGGSAVTLVAIDANGKVQVFPVSAKSKPIELLTSLGGATSATAAAVLAVDPIVEEIEKLARAKA